MASLSDGASCTMLVAETMETTYARWMIGTEVTMATLPGGDTAESSPPGPVTIVGFWTGQAAGAAGTGNPNYYAPTGFDGANFGANSAIPATYKTFWAITTRPTRTAVTETCQTGRRPLVAAAVPAEAVAAAAPLASASSTGRPAGTAAR